MTLPAAGAGTSLPREILTGWRHTTLLLTWRWRAFRTPQIRTGIVAGAFILFLGLLMSANLGFAIRLVAASEEKTAATIFAASWIFALQANSLGDIGALTIGGAVVAAVFAPFTGSSTLALAPVEDLHGLRLARMHRYFDSLLINAVSGIGLLQLLALTAITSVLTLDGQRGPSMLITWLVWFLVIALTTTSGWTLEWVVRRWGPLLRWIVAALMLAVGAAAVYFDPAHGKTLFGLGDTYARTLRQAAQGHLTVLIVPTVILVAAGVVLLLAGLLGARAALALPAVVTRTARERRAFPTPRNKTLLATVTLLSVLWRTPECRRPIAAVAVVGIPGVAFVDMAANLESAIMLAVPLAIALAWGVNLFAVFGPAMTWLTAQPALLRNIAWLAAAAQAALTFLLIDLLWLVSFLAGKSTLDAGWRLTVGAVVGGMLTAGLSINLSVSKPIRARLSGRGDALIPPLTALAYLVRLMLLACVPAAVLAILSPAQQAIGLSAVLLITVLLVSRASRRWHDPVIRSNVVATVAST